MRGALGVGSGLGAHAGLMGDGEGEVLEALGLLQDRAELLLERYGREPGAELLERHLQVLVVEELGIEEAGADDALVAVDEMVSAHEGRPLATTTNWRVRAPEAS